MKTVILAGGQGTRISEETEKKPKPMVEINDMPLLWHIMKEFSYYNYNDFIVCAGYKQEYIKQWFARYFINSSDITFNYREDNKIIFHKTKVEPWQVTIVNTGCNTNTGGRIKQIKEYINNETFFLTYGDGLCDINLNKLYEYHKNHGKIATITSVNRKQDKGILDIDLNNTVKDFREKNYKDFVTINAGYMVVEPEIFNYIDGDECSLEFEVFKVLAKEGQLKSYHHEGFWQCVDCLRDKFYLEELAKKGFTPWLKSL
ncbi:MAG: glucose-1-phosphate cytidylyltransferase [Muribaculaceae bacterium]|nr:glucose-1-phosphate cytidylyltransferase [Muribaculaceae bacterium]